MNQLGHANMLGSLYGLQCFVDDSSSTVFDRRRPWKERLFTRPWQPFLKDLYKTEMTIPDGRVLRLANTIFANAKTMQAIKQSIRN